MGYAIMVTVRGARSPLARGVVSPLAADPQSAQRVRPTRVSKPGTRVINQ